MGFISDLAKSSRSFPGQNLSRISWEQTFGRVSTNRSEAYAQPPVRPGGSYGRSMVSGDASQKRLIQAMRSMAPGGWSDDRFEQSRHWTDIRYIAGHRIGEQLIQSEFQVFKKDPVHQDGKRPVTPQDPPEGNRPVRPYDLVKLLEKPNNDDTFGEMLYGAHQQLTLTGMWLNWMVPGFPHSGGSGHPDPKFADSGTPFELYTVPTSIAIPQPAINPDFPDGYYRIQPIYPYGPFSSYPTPSTSVGAPIPAQWMIRTKYIHPILRYDGFSPQTGLRLVLDEIEQMDRSRWYTLKRLINPSAILNFGEMDGMQPLPEAEIERIKAEFENELQGTENSGRLFVATAGANLEPFNTSFTDLQYKEGWDQLVSFAMAALGISKEAAGMIGTTAYAQLYAALKQLHLLTLVPICSRIAAKLTRHLAPFFGDDLIIEIRPPKIDDHDITFAKINTGMQAKVLKKKDVLKMLDMELTGEEWEDDFAGDPTPYEKEQTEKQEQMAMGPPGGMPGPGGPPAPGGPPGGAPGQMPPQEAPEVAAARPTPGKLGEGALGPKMKSLMGSRRNGRH